MIVAVIKEIIVLFDLIENISLDARLATYINKTNIPPRKTRNRINENQGELLINEIINEIMIVWIIRLSPIDRGWFIIKKNMDDIDNIISIIKSKLISGGSLIKIAVLGIVDESSSLLILLEKNSSMIYKTIIFIKL